MPLPTPSLDVWTCEHYELTGPAHIRFYGRRLICPARVSRFIAKSAMRGGGWMLFLRKIDPPPGCGEWWVSHHKTRAEAEVGA